MAKLNTSCKAIFKSGIVKEFKSIEEASKKTGISVASIKIRCNKKGSGGKDGTLFEWLNERTKKHFQGKRNKSKGRTFEADIVNHLKEIGYKGCVRSASESKRVDNDKIDIIDREGKLPCNIQAKMISNTPSYFDIRDACPDKSKPFCILWKKSPEAGSISRGSIAMIPIDFFYKLLKNYTDE